MSSTSVVILAHRGDVGAAALAAALRHRGGRVDVLDERFLVRAVVRHRPASGPPDADPADAPVRDAVVVRGPGRRDVVVDSSTGAVVCRLLGVTAPRFASAQDQEYAEQELFALALSWLHGLGPVMLNPPSAQSLAGAAPDRLAVHALATRVGLRPAAVRRWTNGARTTLPRAAALAATAPGPRLPLPGEWQEPMASVRAALVCGDDVVGAPGGLEEATVALAHAAGLDAAEVTFGLPHDGPPVVTGVSAVPVLADPAHVAALADHVARRALRERAADGVRVPEAVLAEVLG